MARAAEAAEEAAGVKSHFAKLTNNSPALLRTASEPQLLTLSALNFDSVMGTQLQKFMGCQVAREPRPGHMRQISKLSATPLQLGKVFTENKRSHLIPPS